MPNFETKEVTISDALKSTANPEVLYNILSDACTLRIALYGAPSDAVKRIMDSHLTNSFHNKHSEIRNILRTSIRNEFFDNIKTQFQGYIMQLTDERIRQILIDDIEEAASEKSLETLLKEFRKLRNTSLDELQKIACSADSSINAWHEIFEIAHKKISLTEKIARNTPDFPISTAIFVMIGLLLLEPLKNNVFEYLFTEVTPLLGLPPMDPEDVARNKSQDKTAAMATPIMLAVLAIIFVAKQVIVSVFKPTNRDLTALLIRSCRDYLDQRPEDIDFPLVKEILPPPSEKPPVKEEENASIFPKLPKRFQLPSFFSSSVTEETKKADKKEEKQNEKITVKDDKGNDQIYYKLKGVEGNVYYHLNPTRYPALFSGTGLEGVFSAKIATKLNNDPTVHPADSKLEGLKHIGKDESVPKGVVAKFKFKFTGGRLWVNTRPSKSEQSEPECDAIYTPRNFKNTHS